MFPAAPVPPHRCPWNPSPPLTTFWNGVWPRCAPLIVWKLSMTLEFFWLLSTVPDGHWIHQPLFSLRGHLWCHCKHKLCPEMKDQPEFVPSRGQSNSKCGQATARIIGLAGHYGGSERSSLDNRKKEEILYERLSKFFKSFHLICLLGKKKSIWLLRPQPWFYYYHLLLLKAAVYRNFSLLLHFFSLLL